MTRGSYRVALITQRTRDRHGSSIGRLAQLSSVMVVVLLVAIGLQLLLGHRLEAVAIGVIALFTVVLGFLQEFRAPRCRRRWLAS